MTHPHSPEISILLPTYNGDRFLAKQLDSILSQSFSNFELLIIDDGSTDSTVAIIESYVQVDPRIEVLPSEGNRGHKSRLVELIDRSSAPFIAISDQDDIWHRDKLKRLTAALGTASLAFGRSDLIDAEGNRLNRTLLDVLRRPRRPGDRLSLLFRPQVSGHAMLARREIFSKTAFDSSEPYDWLISLLAEIFWRYRLRRERHCLAPDPQHKFPQRLSRASVKPAADPPARSSCRTEGRTRAATSFR